MTKIYCSWEQDDFDASEFAPDKGWLHEQAGEPWHNRDGYETDELGDPITESEYAEEE